MYDSIVVDTDSYKVSMWLQYPPGTEYVYSYIVSRGGMYAEVEWLGIQRFAKRLASTRVTKEEVEYAKVVWEAHGEPFNYDGWMYIVNELNGALPLRIEAVPEGTIVPVKNVLATIVNTDPKCFWLTTWVETAALRATWYPTTVGTVSWNIRNEILAYLDKSGDPLSIGFKLHDFGARGVSSNESARVGGAAHLVNFQGTDTFVAVLEVMDTYGAAVSGFSIPAAEHSTITSWGKANEVGAYSNMLDKFAKEGAIVAIVIDSYNPYEACEKLFGTELRDKIIESKATVVLRPDSGDPVEVLPRMFRILESKFGATKNAKGYKLLNNIRVLWGDGINAVSLSSILRILVDVCGYSADNIAFGMGGGLLQQCDRDTQEFAMKCSAIAIRMEDGSLVWQDVFKDPSTASNKASLKGLIKLWKCGTEYVTSVNRPTKWVDNGFEWKPVMEVYYENGEQVFTQTFEEVRTNAWV